MTKEDKIRTELLDEYNIQLEDETIIRFGCYPPCRSVNANCACS